MSPKLVMELKALALASSEFAEAAQQRRVSAEVLLAFAESVERFKDEVVSQMGFADGGTGKAYCVCCGTVAESSIGNVEGQG